MGLGIGRMSASDWARRVAMRNESLRGGHWARKWVLGPSGSRISQSYVSHVADRTGQEEAGARSGITESCELAGKR